MKNFKFIILGLLTMCMASTVVSCGGDDDSGILNPNDGPLVYNLDLSYESHVSPDLVKLFGLKAYVYEGGTVAKEIAIDKVKNSYNKQLVNAKGDLYGFYYTTTYTHDEMLDANFENIAAKAKELFPDGIEKIILTTTCKYHQSNAHFGTMLSLDSDTYEFSSQYQTLGDYIEKAPAFKRNLEKSGYDAAVGAALVANVRLLAQGYHCEIVNLNAYPHIDYLKYTEK